MSLSDVRRTEMFCSSSALDARRIFLRGARATVPIWRCLVGRTRATSVPPEHDSDGNGERYEVGKASAREWFRSDGAAASTTLQTSQRREREASSRGRKRRDGARPRRGRTCVVAASSLRPRCVLAATRATSAHEATGRSLDAPACGGGTSESSDRMTAAARTAGANGERRRAVRAGGSSRRFERADRAADQPVRSATTMMWRDWFPKKRPRVW